MRTHTSTLKAGLWLVLISWTVTLLFWTGLPAHLQGNESDDYHNYYQPVALRLLSGQGLTTPDGLPLLRYPPGYPVILAALFFAAQALHIPADLIIQLFILLCVGLIVLLLFLLASDVFGRTAGFLAGLVWIAYPVFLWLTKQPNSELPFLVLFLGGMLSFWKAYRTTSRKRLYWLFTGVLIGSSVLVRPAGLGVIGVLLVVCLISQQLNLQHKVSACLALTISFSAVLLPWELWAYAQTRQVIPVSTGAVPGIWDGLTFGTAGADEQFRARLPVASRQFMEDLQEKARLHGSVGEIQDIWNIFIQQARTQPLAALQFTLLKAARSWFATDSGRFESLNLAVQVFFLAGIVWGALSAWQSGSLKKEFVFLVSGISLYFWLMAILSLSILRYTLPAMALLVTLIPAGIFRLNVSPSMIDRFFSRLR